MLSSFVDLNAGDWIAQNAGNSSVANCVMAIAKSRGYGHSILPTWKNARGSIKVPPLELARTERPLGGWWRTVPGLSPSARPPDRRCIADDERGWRRQLPLIRVA